MRKEEKKAGGSLFFFFFSTSWACWVLCSVLHTKSKQENA
jgi:hypothetical protein